jgi:uncharacterized membrane protein
VGAFESLLVVLHILMVLWLVAGIVGRDLCHHHAARTRDLPTLKTLVAMGGTFERAMVRPSTFAVLLTGLIAAWARGWPILGVLQGGGVNWVLAALVLYLSIIPVIILVFLPRGRIFRRALDEAETAGVVTPALETALRDRAVAIARGYEAFMIAALVWLMVAKPF